MISILRTILRFCLLPNMTPTLRLYGVHTREMCTAILSDEQISGLLT